MGGEQVAEVKEKRLPQERSAPAELQYRDPRTGEPRQEPWSARDWHQHALKPRQRFAKT